jgi:hypothetical protein
MGSRLVVQSETLSKEPERLAPDGLIKNILLELTPCLGICRSERLFETVQQIIRREPLLKLLMGELDRRFVRHPRVRQHMVGDQCLEDCTRIGELPDHSIAQEFSREGDYNLQRFDVEQCSSRGRRHCGRNVR